MHAGNKSANKNKDPKIASLLMIIIWDYKNIRALNIFDKFRKYRVIEQSHENIENAVGLRNR